MAGRARLSAHFGLTREDFRSDPWRKPVEDCAAGKWQRCVAPIQNTTNIKLGWAARFTMCLNIRLRCITEEFRAPSEMIHTRSAVVS